MRNLLLAFAYCWTALAAPKVEGEAKVWHRIAVTFEGSALSEDANPNPFLDNRLDVEFSHPASGTKHTVAGHYAADGRAAESSAKSGGVWRAYFTPDKPGAWTYAARFRQGKDVTLADNADSGQPESFNGAAGKFTVLPTDKRGIDFRAKGRLDYVNGHYLRHAGNGEYFLKGGADSPENFLAYSEFDGTFDTDAAFNEGRNNTGKPFIHRYAPHARDWKPGDPVWQKTKGRNIIGALNYLASKGMNSVYFLTYNIDTGDGKDIWMWTSPDVRDRFDVSKLDQWEIVFSHMDRLGLMMHVILHETENDRKLGGSGGLNPIRRLYLREIVSRFAHHPAIVWNLGEENNMCTQDRKAIAAYIRSLDPYKHPITVHTHVNRAAQDYAGILGDPSFETTSIQGDMKNYHADAMLFRDLSARAGRKWVVFGDEQPHADSGVLPDADDPSHDIPRVEALWGNMMGGGAGVEWYFGYKYAHMDLNCEDWRSRDLMWDQTRNALDFFRRHLPFWDMTPQSVAAEPGNARVLAKVGEVYAVQLPAGGSPSLELAPGDYTVQWYDPRSGGELRSGTVAKVAGAGMTRLGAPPSNPDEDWLVLVKRYQP